MVSRCNHFPDNFATRQVFTYALEHHTSYGLGHSPTPAQSYSPVFSSTFQLRSNVETLSLIPWTRQHQPIASSTLPDPIPLQIGASHFEKVSGRISICSTLRLGWSSTGSYTRSRSIQLIPAPSYKKERPSTLRQSEVRFLGLKYDKS